MKPRQPLATPTSDTTGPPGERPNGAANGVRIPLRFSKKRLGLAFAIAAIFDIIGAFFTLAPPVVWGVDIVTAVLLLAVLGWQWPLLPGLVMEAIPGVAVLPSWLLVVGGIATWGTARPKLEWFQKTDGEKQ